MMIKDFIGYVEKYGADREKAIEAFKKAAVDPDLAVGFLATTKIIDSKPEYEITLDKEPVVLKRFRCSPDHMGYAYKIFDTEAPWFTGNNNITYGSWDCRKALKEINIRY